MAATLDACGSGDLGTGVVPLTLGMTGNRQERGFGGVGVSLHHVVGVAGVLGHLGIDPAEGFEEVVQVPTVWEQKRPEGT